MREEHEAFSQLAVAGITYSSLEAAWDHFSSGSPYAHLYLYFSSGPFLLLGRPEQTQPAGRLMDLHCSLLPGLDFS
ncbi:hypothetical protein Y1Q_0002684 [Alligator mississippiensis]|uniref:Uncharacterized protein n=1 Tax=Alligator mississippiensis TaxID=8496 RepID=A0A151NZ65_ALLMI|nr:hypothetical protein Y1Q_0002684 [Alligator mississippiensis]